MHTNLIQLVPISAPRIPAQTDFKLTIPGQLEISDFANTILSDLKTTPEAVKLQTPFSSDSYPLKAMVFPHEDQFEIYIFEDDRAVDKVEDGERPSKRARVGSLFGQPKSHKGQKKTYSIAIRLLIPKAESGEVVVDTVARLVSKVAAPKEEAKKEAVNDTNDEFEHEVKMLKLFEGEPGVPELYASATYAGHRKKQPCQKGVIFQKNYPAGDFEEFLLNDTKVSSPAERFERHYEKFKGFINSLLILKNKGVLHNDLKLANYLLADDGSPTLTDFEFSLSEQDRQDVNLLKEYVKGGSFSFLSPERYRWLSKTGPIEDVGYPSDVWAVGVILFYMYNRRWPGICILMNLFYEKLQEVKAIKEKGEIIPDDLRIEAKDLQNQIATELKNLEITAARPTSKKPIEKMLTLMLDPHPSRRLTAEEAMEWIVDLNPRQ